MSKQSVSSARNVVCFSHFIAYDKLKNKINRAYVKESDRQGLSQKNISAENMIKSNP